MIKGNDLLFGIDGGESSTKNELKRRRSHADISVWCCSVDEFDLSTNDESTILSIIINSPEKSKVNIVLRKDQYNSIMKYRKQDDKKRSLLSLLMQKSLIKRRWNLQEAEFEIRRTPQNKPYMDSNVITGSSEWNYNVSHHGNFVCIASHGEKLVGIDLVDIQTRSSSVTSAAEFVEMFREHLTDFEMRTMNRLQDDNRKYTLFFIYWSLKEAFIKAIGMGLGFNLKEVEFSVHFDGDGSPRGTTDMTANGTATARIHGVLRNDWKFDFCYLDDRHVLSSCTGPLSDALAVVPRTRETLSLASPLPSTPPRLPHRLQSHVNSWKKNKLESFHTEWDAGGIAMNGIDLFSDGDTDCESGMNSLANSLDYECSSMPTLAPLSSRVERKSILSLL
jgi:4'-phosphopantetheinyl transferase